MKFGVTYSRISMVLYIIIALFLIGFIWWVTQRPKNEYLVENFKKNKEDDGGKDRGKKKDRMNKIEKAFEEYLESILKYIQANDKTTVNGKKAICAVVASEYYYLESLLSCFKDTFENKDFLQINNIRDKIRDIDNEINNIPCEISDTNSIIISSTDKRIKSGLFTSLFTLYKNLECKTSGSDDDDEGLTFSAKIEDGTGMCLGVDNTSVKLVTKDSSNCKTWFDNKKGHIFYKDNGRKCLTANNNTVSVSECDKDSENQKWDVIGNKIKLRNTNTAATPVYLKVTTTGATLVSNTADANTWKNTQDTIR